MNRSRKKALIRKLVVRERMAAARFSDAIADLAEPGFQEVESSRLLAGYLADRGFRVTWPWRHMPTAFKAVRGEGRPSVGLLAEYDALPDCGPKPGTWGHACGHNLLGVGSAVAAVATAGALDAQRGRGSVVLWGCPAEEIGAGKVYMARDGAFRGHDAVLAWHPGGNKVSRKGGSAIDSIVFEFFGKTAHAAAEPHEGRSAMDGVMLLDVAANYLREHVAENVRIHMCVRSGGDAPNVVPAYAKAWYYVRGKDRAQVDGVRERLVAAARGAAMASGTRVKVQRLSGIYSRLENDAMHDALLENFRLFGAPRVTPQDKTRLRKLGVRNAKFHAGLDSEVGEQGRGSTDEDNVSWLAPLGRITVACTSKNAKGHHRDYTAEVKLPLAHRGTLRAAEIMAATALDLCTDAALLRKVKAEFRRRRGRFAYDPLVPKRQKPPTVNP